MSIEDLEIEETEETTVEETEEAQSAHSFDDIEEGSEGPSFGDPGDDGWKIDEFVEDVKEDPNVNFFDQIPGGESSSNATDNSEQDEEHERSEQKASSSGNSQKDNFEQSSIIVDAMDLILAGACVMLAQDKPSQIDNYRASKEYKKQMAQQLAKCEWSLDVKPEWMLVFIVAMAYGPNLYTAWRKRKARTDIREKRGTDGSVDVEIHLVEDPVTGEWVEVSRENFEAQANRSSSSSSYQSPKKEEHPCANCGQPTTNAKYCSRSCSAQAMNKEKRSTSDVEFA